MIDLDSIPLIQARNFRKGRRSPISLIVLHDMEAARTSSTARNVAKWFAGPAAPMASCAYCVDAGEVVCSVRPDNTAFHAPGANAQGIGIELAGFARQTEAEWLDAYGYAELDLAAQLVAALCDRYQLPPQFVDAAGILRGEKGLTTHAECTKAFHTAGGHTDPGKGFPLDWFVARVAGLLPYPAGL